MRHIHRVPGFSRGDYYELLIEGINASKKFDCVHHGSIIKLGSTMNDGLTKEETKMKERYFEELRNASSSDHFEARRIIIGNDEQKKEFADREQNV